MRKTIPIQFKLLTAPNGSMENTTHTNFPPLFIPTSTLNSDKFTNYRDHSQNAKNNISLPLMNRLKLLLANILAPKPLYYFRNRKLTYVSLD